jgi:hypothetical protein
MMYRVDTGYRAEIRVKLMAKSKEEGDGKERPI